MLKNKTITVVALVASFYAPTFTYADVFATEIVKLYSEGKMVAQWQAAKKGRMEGSCYVFRINKGLDMPEVRVCGTFTVEPK